MKPKHLFIGIAILVCIGLAPGLLVSQSPDPGLLGTWSTTIDYIQNGEFTMTYKTLTSPTITNPVLENGEIIVNDSDGEVSITFNDSLASLGDFVIESSLDTPNVVDNHDMNLIYRFNDDTSGIRDYATIIATATDVTAASLDSKLGFKVVTGGTASIPLELTGNTLTLDQGATIGNTGADSLIFTEAGSRFTGTLRASGGFLGNVTAPNGATLTNPDADTLKFTESVINLSGTLTVGSDPTEGVTAIDTTHAGRWVKITVAGVSFYAVADTSLIVN